MPESKLFVIQHLSSRKVLLPSGGEDKETVNIHFGIIVHNDVQSDMHWKFVREQDHWGYIQHVQSQKILSPKGCSLTPGNGTELVLQEKSHWGALFTIDASNHRVIHRGGKFATPHAGRPDPEYKTKLVLHSDVHAAMEFGFFSPTDMNQEVLVYGEPTLAEKWKIIHMIINHSQAQHQFTLQVKVGKSTTESKTTGFEYSWQASAGFKLKMLSLSASQSMKAMIEKTSSQTWADETTTTSQITVNPGDTVVTWQWVLELDQNETITVFHSNLLANTDSETKVPRELQ